MHLTNYFKASDQMVPYQTQNNGHEIYRDLDNAFDMDVSLIASVSSLLLPGLVPVVVATKISLPAEPRMSVHRG